MTVIAWQPRRGCPPPSLLHQLPSAASRQVGGAPRFVVREFLSDLCQRLIAKRTREATQGRRRICAQLGDVVEVDPSGLAPPIDIPFGDSGIRVGDRKRDEGQRNPSENGSRERRGPSPCTQQEKQRERAAEPEGKGFGGEAQPREPKCALVETEPVESRRPDRGRGREELRLGRATRRVRREARRQRDRVVVDVASLLASSG